MNEKQTGNIVTNGINSRSLWAEAWLRFKRNRVAVAGLIFVAFLIVVSIATLVLDLVTSNEIYNAYVVKQNLSLKLAPPSAEHVFGCDEYGRDILFRLIWGTRYSLFIGVVSIAIALVGGGILGSIAGYGGKVDQMIMRVMDVFLSIPSMVMAIAIVSALGTGMTNLLFSIAVPQIPRLARIVRASVMSVKDREFVEAARSVGYEASQIRYTPHGRRCSTAPARAFALPEEAAPDSGRKGCGVLSPHALFELPPAPVPQTTVPRGLYSGPEARRSGRWICRLQR